MTQEDKQLLLKDLCARLPYGVNVLADIDKTFDGGFIGIINKIEPYVGNKFPELKGQYLLYQKGCLTPLIVDEVRPYLRPMSSMTEEEEKEIRMLHHCFYREGNGWITAGVFGTNDCGCTVFEMADILNYLNTHHFDYRGLIEKGLALESPEGMYKID